MHPSIPLQLVLPGNVMVVLFLGLLFLVVPFVVAYWVYNDAEARGEENAALWAVVAGLASVVGTPIVGLLVVVVYVWQRG